MTEEERKKLDETHAMQKKMHAALFEVPLGSKEPPLIEKIRVITRAAEHGSWALRCIIWAAPVIVSAYMMRARIAAAFGEFFK